VRLHTAIRSSALHWGSSGATDPDGGFIRTNSRWFSNATLARLAGHWTHEYMHVLGFTHAFASTPDRPSSVPYAAGLFTCQIARNYVPEAYEPKGVDQCIATMRGP
jgi:hypothetical protein